MRLDERQSLVSRDPLGRLLLAEPLGEKAVATRQRNEAAVSFNELLGRGVLGRCPRETNREERTALQLVKIARICVAIQVTNVRDGTLAGTFAVEGDASNAVRLHTSPGQSIDKPLVDFAVDVARIRKHDEI